MARGKIIDAGALYQSGVAGRDTAAAIAKQAADKRRALTEGLVKTAYSLIGREIIGQVKRNYETLCKRSKDAQKRFYCKFFR